MRGEAAAVARGLALIVVVYGLMAAMGLVLLPAAAFGPRRWAGAACRAYARLALGLTRGIAGLRTEVRGPTPRGPVLIAAKHQSFLDILMLVAVLERPRFVMKRSLLWAPVLGFYARRIGCVAIDRSRGREAKAAILRARAETEAGAGPLVIYPQGTRVAPGVRAPWRSGVAALYEAEGGPCIPAATNAGVFWPRTGLARRPGTAVLAFLPPIEPGLGPGAFMARLERDVETASDALLAEARGGAEAPRG